MSREPVPGPGVLPSLPGTPMHDTETAKPSLDEEQHEAIEAAREDEANDPQQQADIDRLMHIAHEMDAQPKPSASDMAFSGGQSQQAMSAGGAQGQETAQANQNQNQ